MNRSGQRTEATRAAGGPRWDSLEGLEPRWLLATMFVASVADPLENGTAQHPYNLIQEAIDAAAPGDTVKVRPGTYAEDFSIRKANLTLTSTAGAATTIIQGVAHLAAAQFPLADANIEILGNGAELSRFTIRSPAAEAGFYSSGIVIDALDVEIHHNVFQVATAASWDDVSQGIQSYRDDNGPNKTDLSGLSIHDNAFASLGTCEAGYEAIFINHTNTDPTPAGDITIANNTIRGKVVRGITSERSRTNITGNIIQTTLDRHGYDALDPDGTLEGINVRDYDVRPQQDVTVVGNTVTGLGAGAGFSVAVRFGSVLQVLTNVTVSNNIVSAGALGIRVAAGADEVTVTNNSLAGNVQAMANQDAGTTLDASGNWWGSAAAATVAAQAGADVDYTPWLASGTDTSRAIGFQGSFTTLYVDDDSPQAGDTGRIQEAVNLVTGSTVYVLAGTYAEDLNLDHRGLRLIGAGRAATIVVGQSTGFADPGPRGNVVVDAANVTITGFKFQSGDIAPDKVGTAIYLMGRAGNTAMNLRLHNNEIVSRAATEPDGHYDVNGIETDDGNLSGTWIYNNRFTGTPDDGYNGIYVNGAVHGCNVSAYNRLRIFNNTFVGNVQRGIAVETSNTDIAGNILTTRLAFADAWTGIQVQGSDAVANVTISRVQNLQPAQGSDDVRNVTISRNVITGFNWAMELGMTGFNQAMELGMNGRDRGQLLGNLVVLCNIVVFNNQGILVRSSADGVRLLLNRLTGSVGLAVENADPDQHVLAAYFNWWGDETGPTHASNPLGQGETVSDFVAFAPWLRA